MAIKLFPYADSTGEIKYYTTDHIAINGKNIMEKTIYSNGLAVSAKASPNLSVNVASGQCSYNGKFLNSTTTENVTIEANTTNYNRYDLIVADFSGKGSVKAIKGTASANPTTPSTASNQIVLAKVLVGSNVSSIQANNITDLRFTTSKQYSMTSMDISIHELEDRVKKLEDGKLVIYDNFLQTDDFIKIEHLSEYVDTGYKQNNIYFYLNSNYLKKTKPQGSKYSIITLSYFYGMGTTYSVVPSLSSSHAAIISGKFDGGIKYSSPTPSGMTIYIPNNNDELHDCTLYIQVSGK